MGCFLNPTEGCSDKKLCQWDMGNSRLDLHPHKPVMSKRITNEKLGIQCCVKVEVLNLDWLSEQSLLQRSLNSPLNRFPHSPKA